MSCHRCTITRWRIAAMAQKLAGKTLEQIHADIQGRAGSTYSVILRKQTGLRMIVVGSPYGVSTLVKEKVND